MKIVLSSLKLEVMIFLNKVKLIDQLIALNYTVMLNGYVQWLNIWENKVS